MTAPARPTPRWIQEVRAALSDPKMLDAARRSVEAAILSSQAVPGHPIPDDQEPEEPK